MDGSVTELAAELLERATDPWVLEQLLRRLSTMDDPGAALQPLTKRAGKLAGDPEFVHLHPVRASVATLVLLATGADRSATRPDDGVPLLSGRLAEVADRLRGNANRDGLLATPTDVAGWVEPAALVARVAALTSPPGRYDLVAALLRLSTEDHPMALRAARDLPGEAGHAVRYALGGPPAAIATPSAWVAAARARAPFDDDPHLIAAGLTAGGQGRAARYRLELTPVHHEERAGGGRVHRFTLWRTGLAVEPPTLTGPDDQPTVVAAVEQSYRHGEDAPEWLAWAARTWPHDAEPFFARSVFEVLAAASVNPEVTYGTAAVLAALINHPGRRGPMAAATLAAALSASMVEHRAQAADAFAALVPDRLAADQVAAAMAELAGMCTATRWASTLRDAASTSPGAGRAVVDVLARLLPRLPTDLRGLHALLDTLLQGSLRVGVTLRDPELRAWLATVKGGSRTAQAARALLAEAAA